MASVGSVIYKKLNNDATINATVDGNILPQFRDDLVPSIVYETTIKNTNDRYEGLDPIEYEIRISVVGNSYAKAAEIAELIIAEINYQNWSDSPYVVLGCFYTDWDETSVEIASKNKRLAVVELRFDLIVK